MFWVGLGTGLLLGAASMAFLLGVARSFKGLNVLLAAMVLPVCACAGQLRTTFTAPSFEASISGPDTCAAGSVAEATNMTIRRKWSGPSSGQDSLTGVQPGAPCVMTAGVPTGTYTVTVDARDTAGNWSCPVTGTFLVHGKPARIGNLGEAMLVPRRLPQLLAARLYLQGKERPSGTRG